MNTAYMQQIKEIYDLFQDDLSKEIFEYRLMYSLSEDNKYIRKTACTIDIVKNMYEQIKNINGVIGIFGAGVVAKALIKTYDDIQFQCLIDNKKAGTKYENIPVISPKEFKENYPDGYILISTKLYYEEILMQLLKEGWQEEKIINVGKEYAKLNHIQYFDLPYLERAEEEVFVDGGSFDGNTSLDFENWCKDKEVKNSFVYIWEPDSKNIEKCKKNLLTSKIYHEFISKGLWNKKDVLQFNMDNTSSAICETGKYQIETDSIDNICKIIPTFIKMDVEGAEYNALLGARKVISKYKPKLAICVYHKPEDIWQLPILIHEINPEYKFYLRHYSFAHNETVLYAI